MPRTVSVRSESDAGHHDLAVLDWGSEGAEGTVVCVHGLTGCARDFDVLAKALVECGYRVVCPDLVGRGDSGWLADPREYRLRQYARDMHALLAQLDLTAVDWIGTSLGGLIGMALAARPESPLGRLVLNDIGPFVPRAALQRLGEHLGRDPRFADAPAAERYLRRTRAPYGRLTDEQWRYMANRSTRPDASGALRLHYDPAVAVPFHESMDEDVDLWHLWDAIECPVLVLRGADSDFLPEDIAGEMSVRGPRARVIEFGDCGHNPPLLDPDQTRPVLEWLGPAHEF